MRRKWFTSHALRTGFLYSRQCARYTSRSLQLLCNCRTSSAEGVSPIGKILVNPELSHNRIRYFSFTPVSKLPYCPINLCSFNIGCYVTLVRYVSKTGLGSTVQKTSIILVSYVGQIEKTATLYVRRPQIFLVWLVSFLCSIWLSVPLKLSKLAHAPKDADDNLEAAC